MILRNTIPYKINTSYFIQVIDTIMLCNSLSINCTWLKISQNRTWEFIIYQRPDTMSALRKTAAFKQPKTCREFLITLFCHTAGEYNTRWQDRFHFPAPPPNQYWSWTGTPAHRACSGATAAEEVISNVPYCTLIGMWSQICFSLSCYENCSDGDEVY